jgi:Sperm-tail PG-rich repeat
MQSAKNLSMYGLEKFGITVIKPSNCFASRVQRFQDKTTKEKTYTPGPG